MNTPITLVAEPVGHRLTEDGMEATGYRLYCSVCGRLDQVPADRVDLEAEYHLAGHGVLSRRRP